MAASDTDVLDTPEAGTAALRGGTLRAGGYGLGLALSLISAPILIHHLGIRDFGRYTTVIALVSLIGVGTEAGLNAIALREYAVRPGQERTHVMRHLLGIRLTVTSAGMLGAVAFAAIAGYDNAMVLGTLAAGAGLVLGSLQALLAVPLQAQLRFGWATLLELGRQTVTVILVVGLAIAGAKLLPFFFIPIVAGMVTVTATVVLVRSTMPLRPSLNPKAWGQLVRDTLPYAAATAVYAAYFRVAIIVMSLRASSLQTGYFATSYRVMEVLISLPAIAVTAAFPVLARAERDDRDRFDRATTRMLEIAFVTGVFIALGVILAAPIIIDILAPPSGAPAMPVLRIQALAMIPTFVTMACVFPLLSLNRQRAILGVNAIAFGASLALVLALVGPFESHGAAAATVGAEAILAGLSYWLVLGEVRAARTTLRSIPFVLAAGGAGAAVLLIPGLPDIADIVVGMLVFAAVLVVTRRIPPELRELLSRGASRPRQEHG